jgi:hypothetical protein
MWQNVVLLVAGGWFGRSVYAREVARRRAGKSIREAVLPRKREDRKVPSVTEVAG